MKVCFIAVSRGTRRRHQRVARGVRRMQQFLHDAAGAPHTYTHSSTHQNLRRAASSHSVRTAWLDARMHDEFCAYHLMHAGIATEKQRAICGASHTAALENEEYARQGDSGPRRGFLGSKSRVMVQFSDLLWIMRSRYIAPFVRHTSQLVRYTRDSFWDSLEWLRVLVEMALEDLLGPAEAEWLEGWFGTGATSWKGLNSSTIAVRCSVIQH